MRDRLLSWLPVVVWALLIYGSSSSAFGAPETSRIIVPILHFLLPGAAPQTLELLHEFMRKSIHFVDYFILGTLLFRALRGAHEKGWALRWALLAVLLAGGYACTDEYHQSFEAGRGPSAMDALLDTSGATAAQIAIWGFLRKWQPARAERVRG